MTESDNLVLADRPYNFLHKSNRENANNDKPTDKEMEVFTGAFKKVLARGEHIAVV